MKKQDLYNLAKKYPNNFGFVVSDLVVEAGEQDIWWYFRSIFELKSDHVSHSIILFTGSNNQFRNYESEFSRN